MNLSAPSSGRHFQSESQNFGKKWAAGRSAATNPYGLGRMATDAQEPNA
jgi:hypothetical protein